MSATPSRQPSIELLQLASTSNLGYCIRVPQNTNDKSMNVLLKEIGNTSNIASIDATDADLFLIQNTPPITTATEQMEREIDIQDKRRRKETGKKKLLLKPQKHKNQQKKEKLPLVQDVQRQCLNFLILENGFFGLGQVHLLFFHLYGSK
jgi:hypothetical protein